MAKGRRKSLTKSIVRKIKYNPPEVNYEKLEGELHDQLVVPDLSANQKQKIWYKEPEENVSITKKLDEDELDDYLNWAKAAAQNCTENNDSNE